MGDELYHLLAPSIPLLVNALLRDEDAKTRANAAGALGNLVRNSDTMCDALVKHGAVLALVQAADCDAALQPRRIALFSLGNLCVYNSCRKVILENDDFSLYNKLR